MARWNDQWQPMFDGFARLKAKWPTRGWSWDGRLQCVCSSFTAEVEHKALLATREALGSEWTSTSIAGAPQILRKLVDRAGGVRTGQIVFSGGPLAGLIGYGLWWPWGDSETTSLRIGLADIDPAKEPYIKFREVFGVTM
jgi:hypothetical protein